MKCIWNTILLIFICTYTYGQVNKTNCKCPEPSYTNRNPDTTFYFTNGKTIALCGYKHKEIILGKPLFSEFVLTVCGEDTAIKFWHALQNCLLSVNRDTLLVEELKYLPTGKNFTFENAIWTIEKIFFVKGQAQRELKINREIKKYNREEIRQVLEEYNTSAYGLDDKKMELAYKLFIAALSGDKKARQYFKEFETKFGTLDGAFAEDYSDLTAMLELWDRKE